MKNDLLNSLEDEAIYIMREVAGQFKNPVLLFSGKGMGFCWGRAWEIGLYLLILNSLRKLDRCIDKGSIRDSQVVQDGCSV